MDALVIDDDSVCRLAVAHTLKPAGYQVITAANGVEALELLMTRRLQLVICDWNMPGLTGVLLCRVIRQTIVDRYVYIVMLTGQNSPGHIIEGLQAGADDYITKPFSPTELTLRVNTGRRILASEPRAVPFTSSWNAEESHKLELGCSVK